MAKESSLASMAKRIDPTKHKIKLLKLQLQLKGQSYIDKPDITNLVVELQQKQSLMESMKKSGNIETTNRISNEIEEIKDQIRKAERGDFWSETDLSPIDNPDNWITVRGSHVYIKPGQSKAVAVKAFLESKGRKKREILSKVAKEKPKEEKKVEKAKEKESLSEKEKKIRKLMDKGNSRKVAERLEENERLAKEVRAEKKTKKTEKEPSKKEESVEKLKEKKTKVEKKLKNAKDGREKTFLQKLLTQLGNRIAARIAQSKKDDFTKEIFTPKCVQKLNESLNINIQDHVDFIQKHSDLLTEDITGLTSPDPESLKKIEELERLIAITEIGTPQAPNWFNYPMTPVMSSFVKGVGGYKGHLLVEYHHNPGKIYGYDARGEEAQLIPELLNSESKGGWIWDKVLGKPSIFGMEEGTFHAFQGRDGQPQFYTSKGAKFVHQMGRPITFTVNPVGYIGTKEQYNQISETTKKIKEKIVEPPTSREPIKASKLETLQREQRQIQDELRVMFEELGRETGIGVDMMEVKHLVKPVVRKVDLTEDFDTSRPGKWITTKYGKRVYIYDIEFYTEAELNPNYNVLVSPILKIDKRLELGYKLDAINNTINSLPVNLTNMVNEIRVYKKITQDPSMRSDKGKVPDAYKKVGWKKTYDQISGVYIIEDNNIILTPDAFWGTVRHEIGHAVWYGLKERDRIKFKELHKEQKLLMLKVARKLISESKKYDKDSWDYLLRKERAEGIKYEANDVEEYFAEGFNRYYEAKAPIYSWQERKYQKQPSSELAHFFRTRMKKYEKEKEVNPFEVITNIV